MQPQEEGEPEQQVTFQPAPPRTAVVLNDPSSLVVFDSPFNQRQTSDEGPWRRMQTSPEHALLKILPSYVSHLKPAVAAAVTKALLDDAAAVMKDLSSLPDRVSSTILRLVLPPKDQPQIGSAGSSAAASGPQPKQPPETLALRPAMSTGSIVHLQTYSPMSRPAATAGQAGSGRAPLRPTPSLQLGRSDSQSLASQPSGLPPLPPTSPSSRGSSIRSGSSTPLTGTPRRLQPRASVPGQTSLAQLALHSDPTANRAPRQHDSTLPHSAGPRLVSATTAAAATAAGHSQLLAFSGSEASQLMALESASLVTTMAGDVMASAVGALAQAAHIAPKHSAVVGKLDSGSDPSTSSAYATSYISDRMSGSTIIDRSSTLSARSSLPSGDRPSAAMSMRSSLSIPERSSGASERGSQLSSRPSWETVSISSRTSTVHGSASSVPLNLRGRNLKLQPTEPHSHTVPIKGLVITDPVSTESQQPRSTGSSIEMTASNQPLTLVMDVGRRAWEGSVSAQQMHATLQHLQILQGQPLVSALAVRSGRGTGRGVSGDGQRGGLGIASISEAGDMEDPASWPSSNASSPAAMPVLPNQRTYRDMAVQTGASGPSTPAATSRPAATLTAPLLEAEVEVEVQDLESAQQSQSEEATGSSAQTTQIGSRKFGSVISFWKELEGGKQEEAAVTPRTSPAPPSSSADTSGSQSTPKSSPSESTSADAAAVEEEEEDSNPDEDVNKAVQLLLRKYYPKLASGLQGVMEAMCSDAELLRLAAAARSAQPATLELVACSALQQVVAENESLKRRVRELEARQLQRLASSHSATGAGPSSPPHSAVQPPRSSSWKEAKHRVTRDTLSLAGREAALHGSGGSSSLTSRTASTRSSSSSAGVAPSIPLSLLLGSRLEQGDVGSARSSEAGTELTFAQNSSPATSSSGGRASLSGTVRTSSDGAYQGPHSIADSVVMSASSSLERGAVASAMSATGGPETQSLEDDNDNSGDRCTPDSKGSGSHVQSSSSHDASEDTVATDVVQAAEAGDVAGPLPMVMLTLAPVQVEVPPGSLMSSQDVESEGGHRRLSPGSAYEGRPGLPSPEPSMVQAATAVQHMAVRVSQEGGAGQLRAGTRSKSTLSQGRVGCTSRAGWLCCFAGNG